MKLVWTTLLQEWAEACNPSQAALEGTSALRSIPKGS